MSFTINYMNDCLYSRNSQALGKRILIIGTNLTFDSDGDVIPDINIPDTTIYDCKPVNINSVSEAASIFGKDNDLFYSYMSLTYCNMNSAYIVNVPCRKLNSNDTSPIVKDREQFKLNLIDAVQSAFEKNDFDICVVTSINIQDDYQSIADMINNTSMSNITKLMLIKARKQNDTETETTWNEAITLGVNNIVATTSEPLSNICIISDNAYYDQSLQLTYQGEIDYDNIDVAAYAAGLLVSSNLQHPSLKPTIFNSIKCSVTDDRVSYFRKNSIRGIILSNFSTLQSGINSKNALYSAINVYRVSVILDDLTRQLTTLVGKPLSIAGANNSSKNLDTLVSQILDKYKTMQILNDFSYIMSQSNSTLTTSVYLNLIMVYDLERVSVINTVGAVI